jgi:hypothetical protein
MKNVFVAALALAGLAGCQHFSVAHRIDRSVAVDKKTRLTAHAEGADLQASIVQPTTPGEPIHRLLRNPAGKVLFAYDVEVVKGATDGAYNLRLKPSGQKPTFAAVREVAVKSRQESVRVDLMENPGTGEKVTDVLQLLPNDASNEMMSPASHLMKLHNMVFRYFNGH